MLLKIFSQINIITLSLLQLLDATYLQLYCRLFLFNTDNMGPFKYHAKLWLRSVSELDKSCYGCFLINKDKDKALTAAKPSKH